MGVDHTFTGRLAYVTRHLWDFFVRQLLNAEPPENYQMTEMSLNPEAMSG
jgi:hypothetical protein